MFVAQIYLCLKKNRTLRPEDEAKYRLYGKLGHMAGVFSSNSNNNSQAVKDKLVMTSNNINNKIVTIETNTQVCEVSLGSASWVRESDIVVVC